MSEKCNFWRKEYQLAGEQFGRFITLYIQVFFIYVGILGVLLSFALGEEPGSEVRKVLSYFALVCCFIFLLCILCFERITGKLKRKRKRALRELGEDTEDELVVGHWVNYVYLLFTVFAMLAWGWLAGLVPGISGLGLWALALLAGD